MRMRSKTNQKIVIALLDGSAIAIGSEFRDIPVKFRRDALSMHDQLEIEGVASTEIDEEPIEPKKKGELLVPIIEMMAASGEPGYFTINGLPNINVLSKLAEYKVSRVEMLAAFEMYNASKSQE